jgi:DNA-binding CsgD family transcriptional regulator
MITAQEKWKEREKEILRLLQKGHKNQEIATQLNLSLQTVKWYLRQIYGRLHVNSRSEAVAEAERIGLFNVSPQLQELISLPQMATPFFGRNKSLNQLDTLLSNLTVRLITIHGIGGIGKTRLAIEAVRRQQDCFQDGVCFVPLRSVQMEDGLWMAIAEKIGITLAEQADPLDELVANLRHANILLLLDNFENLIAFAPRLHQLLWRTQSVKLLVTSRRRLNLHAETVLPLAGFSDQNAAFNLFIAATRRQRIDFEATSSAQTAIQQICESTSQMPLAIELAAMWMNLFSAEQLADELGNGLQLLLSQNCDHDSQRDSLHLILDYTWRYLSPAAQDMAMLLALLTDAFSTDFALKLAKKTPNTLRELLDSGVLHRTKQNCLLMHVLMRQFIAGKINTDKRAMLQRQINNMWQTVLPLAAKNTEVSHPELVKGY